MAEGDLFIKITGKVQGEIKGESQKEEKKEQTEINHFSISCHQPGSYGQHSGGGTGKVTFSDISFSTAISKTSPLIFQAMGNHEVFSEVLLSARKGIGNKQQDYYVIKLTDAVMTDYSISASEHGAPQVTGTLNYKQIKISYWPQTADGTLGEEVFYEFDQSLGQAAA